MEICVIAENSFPVNTGGVSEWCKTLIEGIKDHSFNIYNIAPEDDFLYDLPSNVVGNIIDKLDAPKFAKLEDEGIPVDELLRELKKALMGEALDCESLQKFSERYEFTGEEILGSDANWKKAVEYYEANYADKPFLPFFYSWISLFYVLFKVLEGHRNVPQSNVYHALNAGYAGLMGCLLKERDEKPLVVTEHGLYLKERKFELRHSEVPTWLHQMYENFFLSLVRTSYNNCDVLTSVCQDHVSYQKKIKQDIAPQVIYNGIDTERFDYNPSIRTTPPFVVGTIGRITPIKDTLTYIRAAKDVLQKYPVKFYIVGNVEDDEYYDECKELVETNEIESQVFFTGFQEPSKWYPRFDVFVLPSLSEGLPLTLLEAMSSGVPCVATDVGGTSEVLDDAYLVKKWDPKNLATKITSLLKDPDLRKEISVEVRKVVEAQFTKEAMTDNFRQIYEELA